MLLFAPPFLSLLPLSCINLANEKLKKKPTFGLSLIFVFSFK